MRLKLSDISEKISKGSTPRGKVNYSKNENNFFLRVTDMVDLADVYDSEFTLSNEDINKNKMKIWPINTILVSIEGTVGKISILKKEMSFNQAVAGIVPNEEIINPRYLMYYLRTTPVFSSILKGTIMPALRLGDLAEIEIEVPEMSLQNKVVSIVDSITNKINLNNQINNNLYDEMQTLYDEWFRDFNPFKNEEFKETVLKKIPKRFNVSDIYSISSVIYGAPFKSNLFNGDKNGKPIIRIRDLKEQNMRTYTPEKHSKGYLLQKGDITVGMDGEFRPYFWGNDEAWLNQRVCVFDNKRKKGKAFLYYTLKPLLDFIEKTEVATTVIHIGKNDFDEFKIVLPDDETLDKFDEITNPMVWQIVQNTVQNHKLEQLRDTLLPKLMNGEIDLDNIEI